jgi:hypothetical protein
MNEQTIDGCTYISTSKHYYYKKSGGIGWQKKELNSYSNKIPIVWYIYYQKNKKAYCEIASEYSLKQAKMYFNKAFKEKNGLLLDIFGRYNFENQIESQPNNLLITKKMIKQLPGIDEILIEKGINLFVSSQSNLMKSAIRRLKVAESELDTLLWKFSDGPMFQDVTPDNNQASLRISLLVSEMLNLKPIKKTY